MSTPKNFARTNLTGGPYPPEVTTLVVTHPSRLPAAPFWAVVSGVADPTEGFYTGRAEVIRVTAKTEGVLTVLRGQQGSTAITLLEGWKLEAGLTAQEVTDILTPALEARDQAVAAAQTSVTAAETSVTAAGEAVAARDESVEAKDETVQAKDDTIEARDIVLAIAAGLTIPHSTLLVDYQYLNSSITGQFGTVEQALIFARAYLQQNPGRFIRVLSMCDSTGHAFKLPESEDYYALADEGIIFDSPFDTWKLFLSTGRGFTTEDLLYPLDLQRIPFNLTL